MRMWTSLRATVAWCPSSGMAMPVFGVSACSPKGDLSLALGKRLRGVQMMLHSGCLCPSKFTWPWEVTVLGGVALGRWFGNEGGALINGVSTIMKEAPESSLAPSAMWGHGEKIAVYKLRSRLLTDTESADTLILGFPASRTMKKKCLLFKPHSLWYI